MTLADSTVRYLAGVTDSDLKGLSVGELIALHRGTLHELAGRGILRTGNAPQGDWAELIVATAYSGELAPNSEKSWDIQTPDGRRLQVKARVAKTGAAVNSLVTSPFRSWDFDAAVIVLLADEDLSVVMAAEIPVQLVREAANWRSHVNGWVVTPTPELMATGLDVTVKLQQVADSL